MPDAAVPQQRSSVTLADGSLLDILSAGPQDGIPLVVHHGTPGARIDFEPFISAALARRLRYVSYSRPGYGGSTRRSGRTVAACAADTAAVLDRLGGERFYNLGWSGGGPHAFACAAQLPDRVIAAAVVAGLAPYAAEGLDWTAGMGQETVDEFRAALAGPDQLTPYLEAYGAEFGASPASRWWRRSADWSPTRTRSR